MLAFEVLKGIAAVYYLALHDLPSELLVIKDFARTIYAQGLSASGLYQRPV
jgi:hypothetical protein